MNAGPDVERLIAGWLADEAPGRAPDRILDRAGRSIDGTKQRRLAAAWREPVTISMRMLAAAAAAILVAIAGAAWLGRSSASVGTPQPTTTIPATTPSTTLAAPQAIVPGTYLSPPIPVADILSRLAATNLTEAEKGTVVNDILYLYGAATTLYVELRIDPDRFTMSYWNENAPPGGAVGWRMYTLDATTIAVDVMNSSDNVQAWGVTRVGNGFSLQARSAAPTPVETFVRSVLFESGLFSRID